MENKKIKQDATTEAIPQEGLSEEVEKATSVPETAGVLTIKSLNDCLQDAAKQPNPKTHFHGLIVQYENTVLFASTNVGKSILALQIAEDIAQDEPVYYLDFENTEKQIQLRYTDPVTGTRRVFPPNLKLCSLDLDKIGGMNLEQEILKSIEILAERGIRFFIIDNLTFMCHDAEKSALASEFMMLMVRLKKKYNLTIVIIAHTPKRYGYKPITQYDLAGSSKLISFFDAGIAMARSAKDENLRYLKQVKVRTGTFKYDADNVLVLDLVKDKGYLHFEPRGVARESEHLVHDGTSSIQDEILEILRLQKEGKSYREIAKEMGKSLALVQRRLNTAKAKNITLPEDNSEGDSSVTSDTSVPPVSPVSNNDKPIHDTPQPPPANENGT